VIAAPAPFQQSHRAEARPIEPETCVYHRASVVIREDSGGKLWSKPAWCLCARLSERLPFDPVGESASFVANRAEPESTF
jgi:hypothetical protein